MSLEHNESHHNDIQKFDWYPIGKWGAILIMTYYLWTEHQAHVIQFLPYLFILACPLMHLFMHGDHGHGHKEQSHKDHKNTGEKK